jgi:hypothetical protein
MHRSVKESRMNFHSQEASTLQFQRPSPFNQFGDACTFGSLARRPRLSLCSISKEHSQRRKMHLKEDEMSE